MVTSENATIFLNQKQRLYTEPIQKLLSKLSQRAGRYNLYQYRLIIVQTSHKAL